RLESPPETARPLARPPMNALIFAWRSLVRQPARTVLGILGISAVGALLFDMLMLSNGLLISMEDLLARTGFDIRVSAGTSTPNEDGHIDSASAAAAALRSLREVAAAVPIRLGQAEVPQPRRPLIVTLLGADTSTRRTWTIAEGRDLGQAEAGEALVNR